MADKKYYTSDEAKKRLKTYVLKQADKLEQDIIEDRKSISTKKGNLSYV